MKISDVESVAFRLRLEGRPVLAELLEWTAERAPRFLEEMEYNNGRYFPELFRDDTDIDFGEWYDTITQKRFDEAFEEYSRLKDW